MARDKIDWLRRLSGFERAPAGLEWTVWRALPRALLWGSAIPVTSALLLRYTTLGTRLAGDEERLGILFYQLLGLTLFVWVTLGTVAIGCIVVMVMKGPAYVADPFPDAAERADMDRRTRALDPSTTRRPTSAD